MNHTEVSGMNGNSLSTVQGEAKFDALWQTRIFQFFEQFLQHILL